MNVSGNQYNELQLLGIDHTLHPAPLLCSDLSRSFFCLIYVLELAFKVNCSTRNPGEGVMILGY